MEVLRFANRVPLQFQHAGCAITQTVMNTNWRSYGLAQSRGSLPKGPVSLMVHIASVWVPFTSESKEAIAGYPEIQKELRLALQAVGHVETKALLPLVLPAGLALLWQGPGLNQFRLGADVATTRPSICSGIGRPAQSSMVGARSKL